MNSALILCLCVLLSSTFAADLPRWCVKNDNELKKCEDLTKKNLTVTCVKFDNCLDAVIKGEADLVEAVPDDIVKNAEKLKIVLAEDYDNGVPTGQYYGVIVVKRTTFIPGNKTLKDTNSCHTGAGRTAGWKIPIGFLLSHNLTAFDQDQYRSAANYFNRSCVPGLRGGQKLTDSATVDKLCALCKGAGDKKCTRDDPYAGYIGAFRCMVEDKGAVAFVKHTTPQDAINKDRQKYGALNDYQLICPEGMRKGISEYKTCNLGKRPSSAVVTASSKTPEDINQYKVVIRKPGVALFDSSAYEGEDVMIDNSTKELKDVGSDPKNFLGSYYDQVKALRTEEVKSGASVLVISHLTAFTIFSISLVFQG